MSSDELFAEVTHVRSPRCCDSRGEPIQVIENQPTAEDVTEPRTCRELLGVKEYSALHRTEKRDRLGRLIAAFRVLASCNRCTGTVLGSPLGATTAVASFRLLSAPTRWKGTYEVVVADADLMQVKETEIQFLLDD